MSNLYLLFYSLCRVCLHDNRLSSIRNETNKVWNRVYMKGFRIGIKPN